MTLTGFKLEIPAIEWLQIHVLDRAATRNVFLWIAHKFDH